MVKVTTAWPRARPSGTPDGHQSGMVRMANDQERSETSTEGEQTSLRPWKTPKLQRLGVGYTAAGSTPCPDGPCSTARS